jgi:hypothetical protein
LAVIFTIIFPAYGDKIGATAGGILFIWLFFEWYINRKE